MSPYKGNRKINIPISIFVVVFAFILLVIPTSGNTEQLITLDKQKLPHKFSIAAPEIRPLVYIDKQGNIAGQFITMFEHFSEQTGIKVDIKVMPWGRAVQQAKSGNSDAIMPALYTNERAAFFAYPSEPLVIFSGSVVLQHRQDTRKIDSWHDIHDSQIVKVRSMNLGENVGRLFVNNRNELVEVVRIVDGLQMLQHKRVDYVVMDALIASSLIEELKLQDEIKVIVHPEESRLSNSYLAFSTSFAAQFDVEKIMALINQYNDPDKYIKQLEIYSH
ncbi:substrate-binding periplasmic protein [Thalassotalea sediminis]|uniref:substrate-binding periplasmic protein n=1 Tax=Thalassotalea sediminis TaxID=1759089 RepID=UPI0025735503|nr:transporter substrate-binding domain-containing protein [Thalassotalea sediminis]